MNFSLFLLLTATTKWSLRLHIVYVVELLQLLLVEASVDPNVAGATPTDDGNAFGVRSLTPLLPPPPISKLQHKKEELAVY